MRLWCRRMISSRWTNAITGKLVPFGVLNVDQFVAHILRKLSVASLCKSALGKATNRRKSSATQETTKLLNEVAHAKLELCPRHEPESSELISSPEIVVKSTSIFSLSSEAAQLSIKNGLSPSLGLKDNGSNASKSSDEISITYRTLDGTPNGGGGGGRINGDLVSAGRGNRCYSADIGSDEHVSQNSDSDDTSYAKAIKEAIHSESGLGPVALASVTPYMNIAGSEPTYYHTRYSLDHRLPNSLASVPAAVPVQLPVTVHTCCHHHHCHHSSTDSTTPNHHSSQHNHSNPYHHTPPHMILPPPPAGFDDSPSSNNSNKGDLGQRTTTTVVVAKSKYANDEQCKSTPCMDSCPTHPILSSFCFSLFSI